MGDRSNLHFCELTMESGKLQAYELVTKLQGDDTDLYNALKVDAGKVTLDIDDWKIQGYWYDSFCDWLETLQACSVRGFVELDLYDQCYQIHFNDVGVYVVIGADPQYSEIAETYYFSPEALKTPTTIYKIHKGQLWDTEDTDFDTEFWKDTLPSEDELMEILGTEQKKKFLEELRLK